MFGTLLESRATRQRRTGGSFASVVIHSVIITAAVVATARDAIVARPPEPVHIVRFNPPPEPAPAPRTQSVAVSSASIVPGPALPRLNVPDIVPVGIPPIDFSAPPTSASDWDGRRVGVGNARCALDDCSVQRGADGDRQTWSTRDILMQMIGSPTPPRFPEALRRAGVEGDVVVRFVVDTTGRVDMGSIEVVSATHDAFVVAVREALAKFRFSPSMAGERKVKALAVMPFRFTLR